MLSHCRDCKAKLPPGMLQCINPKCRTWNVVESLPSNLDEFVERLGTGKARKIERIKTDLVDLVFGGGIARTSVNLLAGEPGAGKTTLCLMLANYFSKALDRDSMYIANEQSKDEIDDTASRLALECRERILIVKAMGGVNFSIGALLGHFKPCFVVLDSITKWVGEDMELAVSIAYQLKEISVSLKAPVIIINQVNKDGDHAGLKKLEHAVDWSGMFDILEGEVDAEGNPIPKKDSPRRLMSTKNRFGPAPEEQFFQMTETGLVGVELEPLDERYD